MNGKESTMFKMTESERGKTSRKTKIDGGYGWVIVFAAFMIHFIVGGIIYTLGVLYTEFLEEFGQGKGNTAWIHSFVPGTMTSVGPIAGALTSRFGSRVVVITGAVIATTGFVLCSFATSIFYLYFTFGFLPVSNIFTSLGYGAPYTYLPDRAEEKGIDKSNSAFLISTIGITNLFGRLIFGFLADHKYVNRLLLYAVSVLICGIANLLNPVDDSYEYLLVYAAIQGMFGGVFISLNTVVLVDFIGLDRLDKGLGLLQAFQGIGNFIGPPITGWFYDGTGSYAASFYFAGCCVSLGGILSIMIAVKQKISKKSHQSHLDKNINLETNLTKF